MADAITAALLKEADAFGNKGQMGPAALNQTAAALSARAGNTNLAADSQRIQAQERNPSGAIPLRAVVQDVPQDPITSALMKEASAAPKTAPQAAPQKAKPQESGYAEPDFTPSDLLSAASKGPAGLAELAVKYRKPLAEVGKTVTTGLGSQILGGLAGLYTLATEGGEKAKEAVEGVQDKLTYQPRGEGAKKILEGLGSNYNPLNWIPHAANAAGDAGVKAGVLDPGEATALSVAGQVVAPGAALKALGKGGTALKDLGRAGTAESAPFGSVGAAAASNSSAARLAAESASPELKQIINKGMNKGEQINPEALKRQLEANSLPDPISLTGPQARGNVVEISHEYNAQGKNEAISKRFNEQERKLKNNINLIRDKAAPDVFGTNAVENGQSLIDSYKATDKVVRADISAKYKALEDANGGNFPIDGKAFAESAEQSLAKKLKTDFLPPAIAKQLDKFKSGEPMNFEQFEAMRTNLAAEIRKAERAGDGNAAYAAGLVRDALEELPLSGEAAKLKPLADAARNAAKARFDLLKKDKAYKAAVNDTVAADDFIKKFVVNGKAADIKAMSENLGRGSPAHQTMAAGLINHLKEKAGIVGVESGGFNQHGYNKALEQVQPKLLDIVGTESAKDLEKLGNVARYTQELRRGNTANVSKTTIAAEAAEHAKNLAEHAANAKTVIPFATMGRNYLRKRAEEKSINEALQTGAGIFIKDIK